MLRVPTRSPNNEKLSELRSTREGLQPRGGGEAPLLAETPGTQRKPAAPPAALSPRSTSECGQDGTGFMAICSKQVAHGTSTGVIVQLEPGPKACHRGRGEQPLCRGGAGLGADTPSVG